MANERAYLFFRYELTIDDEPLDAKAQLTALKELQGQFFPQGPKAEREGLFDSVIMRPRSFTLDDGSIVLTFSIGQAIGARVSVKYDKGKDDIEREILKDDSIRYADFVAVPRLGVLAVTDRSGDEHLTGATAAHRLRSIFRQLDGADATVTAAANYHDVQRAMEKWKLSSFGFTIRPFHTLQASMRRNLGMHCENETFRALMENGRQKLVKELSRTPK
jgi:hypothetical protein